MEELILAMRLPIEADKTEILRGYLASAWFGRGAEGAGHAAHIWFGKPWSEISPAQSATLAAMLKGPSRYDPSKKPDLVKARRDTILKAMHEKGKITDDVLDVALAENMIVLSATSSATEIDTWEASLMRRTVTAEAKARYPSADEELDLSFTGTLDKAWGDIARATLPEGVRSLPGGDTLEGAMVIISVPDGRILATVGGVDAAKSGYDRTAAQRQPGSLAKPLFYLGALDAGMSPWDPVRNDRVEWAGRGWNPSNYDGSQTGPAPLYQGLENSSNLMTLHLADTVDMDKLFDTAEASGAWPFGAIDRFAPSLLGATTSTVPRLTAGIAGIVNGGMTVTPNAIEGVTHVPVRFASEYSSDAITAMMRGVVTRGTASVAFKQAKVIAVGKTGTSQGHRDSWFVGSTPHFAIGVWVGRDDDKPVGSGITGGTAAARIVVTAFNAALEAGLVDEEGYDPKREKIAHVAWPPQPLPHSQGSYETPAIADTMIMENGEFLTITNPDPVGQEQIDNYFVQMDMNADLLP